MTGANTPKLDIYPPGILSAPIDAVPVPTQLQTHRGIVEIIDSQGLTPVELRALLLSAAGFTIRQINDQIEAGKWHAQNALGNAFQKLNVSTQEAAVDAIFTQRVGRVVKPIKLPHLHEDWHELIQQQANGLTVTALAKRESRTVRCITDRNTKLCRSLGARSVPQVILLEHMGGKLSPSNDIFSTQKSGNPDYCRISPGSALTTPSASGVHFNYITCNGGVFSVRKDSRLGFNEQRALVLIAAGFERPEAARIVRKSPRVFDDWMESLFENYNVGTAPAAVFQALKENDLIVTKRRPSLELTQSEQAVAVSAALNLRLWDASHEATSQNATERYQRNNLLQKAQSSTLAGAVMSASMSLDVEIDSITDTSAAPPPASRR